MEEVFRMDYVTTRMGRHAEGLIVLAGDRPGRGWTHPGPLVDALRAAIAEGSDYTRIRLASKCRGALEARPAPDMTHLIADLAENALNFSPPTTPLPID